MRTLYIVVNTCLYYTMSVQWAYIGAYYTMSVHCPYIGAVVMQIYCH